ncbi:MAG: NHLP leader peptide family RiPP precursor [Bryobacteraceae bacterium]
MPTVQDALDRIWSDEALKKRLMTDPKPVLAEFGLQLPPNVKVQIHENTPHLVNAVLIEKPADPNAVQANDPITQMAKRAWTDPAFKARLLANPKDVAQEMGLKLSPDMEVKVWENTPSVHHMVLPVNPNNPELSDADLETVAGGGLTKGQQVAAGCGAGAAAAGIGGAALAFTAVGAAIGFGVAAGLAGAGSTAGGTVTAAKGKA